jgi:hypothetical protein
MRLTIPATLLLLTALLADAAPVGAQTPPADPSPGGLAEMGGSRTGGAMSLPPEDTP